MGIRQASGETQENQALAAALSPYRSVSAGTANDFVDGQTLNPKRHQVQGGVRSGWVGQEDVEVVEKGP